MNGQFRSESAEKGGMKSCEELMMDSLRRREIKLTMKFGAWNSIDWKKRRGKGARYDHKDYFCLCENAKVNLHSSQRDN